MKSLEMARKAIPLVLLLVTTLLTIPPAVFSQTSEEVIGLSIKTTPEPYLNQLTSGDRYRFKVEITNLGVNVAPGQIINASEPWEKYSGNFTVESVFELRKYGGYGYGGQSVSYITSLNNTQIDNYYSIEIPPLGEKMTYVFTYNLTKGYEVFGVRPDENMVLYFRVNVFIQSYSDKDGGYQLHVGERVKTQRNDYYVIDFVKQEYLKGKLKDIAIDVGWLERINSPQVQIGKDYYRNLLTSLNSSITTGNLVLALDQVQRYYQVDQPTLMDLLFYNLNVTSTTANQYATLRGEYDTLNGQYAVLQTDFESLLTANQLQAKEIVDLEAQAKQDRANTTILVGITIARAHRGLPTWLQARSSPENALMRMRGSLLIYH
jgi:hypothetical protein